MVPYCLSTPRVGLTYGPLRAEEQLLLTAFAARGIPCQQVDDRRLILGGMDSNPDWDIVLARGISQQRTYHVATLLETRGVPVVNSAGLLERCNDKIHTAALLARAGIPQPEWRVAFSTEDALGALDEVGYPAVIKPPVGSWGRLLAKVNGPDTAREVVRQKLELGSFHHGSLFIQEYIAKRGRDIRVFVVGDETICAIFRSSDHWITNTARGGLATNCPVTPEIADLARRCAATVGEGLLAIDLFESEGGLLVNEINATMEFRNSIDTTGVDIPGLVVEYVLERVREGGKTGRREPVPNRIQDRSVNTMPGTVVSECTVRL